MPDIAGFTVEVHPDDRQHPPVVEARDGLVTVSVPGGQRFSHSVRIRWTYPECGAKTALIVKVGAGSRVVIIERLMNQESRIMNHESFWSHAADVSIEAGAEVEFISEQSVDPSLEMTIRQRSSLQDNAKISWRNVTLGAGHVHQDLESHLEGADAVSSIDWMFYAKAEEKYELSARNIFNGRNGGGEITMKGVAEEKAHAKCHGMIKITGGGGGTDTYLTQDVLMLDTTSKVDAVPGLEIKTNDVKASHSATVSRVTEEDLFYFAARGIVEKEAKRMFVEGFLGSMTGKIRDAQTREQVLAGVAEKYGE